MKALTCEMCGSTDVVREEDLYVCRHCGTKYTPEAERKIMIEGPVDVSGSTVKIDATQELENLSTLARRAKDGKEWNDAVKYYEMILQREPDDWEANLFLPMCLYKSDPQSQSAALMAQKNRLPLVLEQVRNTIAESEKRAETVKMIARMLADYPESPQEAIPLLECLRKVLTTENEEEISTARHVKELIKKEKKKFILDRIKAFIVLFPILFIIYFILSNV